jgi:hypothetical protein
MRGVKSGAVAGMVSGIISAILTAALTFALLASFFGLGLAIGFDLAAIAISSAVYAVVGGIIGGVIFGAIFAFLYNKIPGTTTRSKAIVLALGYWFIVSVLFSLGDLFIGGLWYGAVVGVGLLTSLIFGFVLSMMWDRFGPTKRVPTTTTTTSVQPQQ